MNTSDRRYQEQINLSDRIGNQGRLAVQALSESHCRTYKGAERKVRAVGSDPGKTGIYMFLAELERNSKTGSA
jgi:hypothetical protein